MIPSQNDRIVALFNQDGRTDDMERLMDVLKVCARYATLGDMLQEKLWQVIEERFDECGELGLRTLRDQFLMPMLDGNENCDWASECGELVEAINIYLLKGKD